MESEWKKSRIEDLFHLEPGFAFKSREFLASGIPVIKIKNIKPAFFSDHEFSYVSDSYLEQRPSKVARVNDLLMSMTGNRHDGSPETWVGKIALFKSRLPHLINQRVGALRVKEHAEIDPVFASYVLSSWDYQLWFISIATSSGGQANLSPKQILETSIRHPSLEEQKRIARILSTLDNKIELNRQMNITLEATARSLFKSWFVDFDPVIDNALAAGNPIPDELAERAGRRAKAAHQQSPEQPHILPTAIRQQFPDRFAFTETIGWMPEVWEVTQIKEIAKVIKGKSYKSSELTPSATALVTLKSFNRGGGYRLDGLKEYSGSYKAEQEVFAGDLVIAYTDVTQAADVIGKPAMIVSNARYEHLVISLDVAVVRPFVDNHKYYLYGLAQTNRFQDHAYSHSTGTTVLHLGKNAVPDYPFAKPSELLLSAYEEIAAPIFSSINDNIAANATLTELRETLLPKLLSGQLRIPEAEEVLAEAL